MPARRDAQPHLRLEVGLMTNQWGSLHSKAVRGSSDTFCQALALKARVQSTWKSAPSLLSDVRLGLRASRPEQCILLALTFEDRSRGWRPSFNFLFFLQKNKIKNQSLVLPFSYAQLS